jgi:hypothetical protein
VYNIKTHSCRPIRFLKFFIVIPKRRLLICFLMSILRGARHPLFISHRCSSPRAPTESALGVGPSRKLEPKWDPITPSHWNCPSTTDFFSCRHVGRTLKKNFVGKARAPSARWCWRNFFLKRNSTRIRSYLFTPLLNPQRPAELVYNERHVRIRNVEERCFGVIKSRFPILAYGCRLKVETVQTVFVAEAILHNIAL